VTGKIYIDLKDAAWCDRINENGGNIVTDYWRTVKSLAGIGCLIIAWSALFIGCKDKITDPVNTNPVIIGDYVLCYEKSYKGHWEIFSNNIIGSSPQNISNYSYDDEYPQWSPDGRYIAFSRNGTFVIVYDRKKQIETNLTSDGGGSSLQPRWVPNGKIYFGYPYAWAGYNGTYIMNPDGSEKKKILDFSAGIYFYQDSYTFLYIAGTKVYKTNIDNTFNEFILDIEPGSNQYFTIRDFNPLSGELLENTNTIPGFSSAIATFSAETKQLNLLLAADKGYHLVEPRYSKDYSKIAYIEIDTTTYNEQYLSVFENGEKRRLVKLTGKEWFDYNPMQFSYDGQYIAFSKNIDQNG
jgi:Tol biopolymer transport system component